MLGAEDALGAGQISVFMCDTRDDPDREQLYLDRLVSRRVDGLIVTGRRIEPRPALDAGRRFPVVYAMTQPLDGDDPAILPDDEGGAVTAARHLLGLGRGHVGHITGPERFLAARKRAAGLSHVLTEAGAPFAADEVLYGEWSERWGRDAARILLAAAPATDAIFCGSDQIARGVADGLRALGCRVPDDVALVGFDNWAPMALGANPPLTTVDVRLEEIGRLAGQHLLAAIGGDPERGVRTVASQLVIRDSAPALVTGDRADPAPAP
jgi:LacI family transcriptional regulator